MVEMVESQDHSGDDHHQMIDLQPAKDQVIAPPMSDHQMQQIQHAVDQHAPEIQQMVQMQQ